MKRFYWLIFSLFIVHGISNAQLSTNSNVSANFLVQNTLLGGGVTATNISYIGDVDAIGSFMGTNCNIGLNSGVIMTTGTVENSTTLLGGQEGPFGPNDNAGAGLDNSASGDVLLDVLSSASTEDAAILEFDFEAVGSSISFRYVFASEEYLEYVNAGFNDVFGFFITGQNPNGGNYSSTNIALIPGTSIPVTIDNLNNVSNNQYYNNNGDGSSAPQNADNTVVQYDGFTDVLTASADVVCGQIYHIKIAIADAGDGSFDSGVFLEAQSFTSVSPISANSQVTTVGNLPANQIMEGCGDAEIQFTRTDSINFNQTFSLSYGGNASNGVDYTFLPSTITFTAGQATQSVNIISIYDLLAEGTESLTVTITYSGDCGQNQTETITLWIVDQSPLTLNLLDQVVVDCLNVDSLNLIASPLGGNPDYFHVWSTGATTSFITVNPLVTTTYYVTVTDDCGYQSVYDSIEVVIPINPPLLLEVSNDTSVMCPNSPVDLFSTITGGAGGYSWSWSNGNSQQDISIQTMETNQYDLTVTDMCGASVSESVLVIVVLPVITAQPYGATSICPGDSAEIGVLVSNGTGVYDYNWSTGETTSEIIVKPTYSTIYYISITDSCAAHYEVVENLAVNVDRPIAEFTLGADNVVIKKPINFINQSEGATSYYWEFGNDEFSTEVDPMTTYYNDGEVTIMLVAENQAGCLDTVYHTYYIQPEMIFFVPNAFTPNGDGNNDYFFGDGVGVKDYEMRIFNRWGEMIYHSVGKRETWDGRVNGVIAPNGVYIWKMQLTGYDGTDYEKTGHVSLIR
jgi:gliding motility-associated-like protein